MTFLIFDLKILSRTAILQSLTPFFLGENGIPVKRLISYLALSKKASNLTKTD